MERPGTLVTKMDAHLDVPDGGSDGRWSGHEIRYGRDRYVEFGTDVLGMASLLEAGSK